MTINKFITAGLVALAFSASSHAALLVSSDSAAGNAVTDYSAAGAVSFDLELAILPGPRSTSCCRKPISAAR